MPDVRALAGLPALTLAVLGALGLTPGVVPPAAAQAYQCRTPRALPALQPVTPDGPSRRRPVAGYTLAASWSPDWCKTHKGTRSMQCDPRYGRFGFILHGLWPEARHGAPPQWCKTDTLPRPATLREHMCMTPSPGLLAHEWAKHGSCMAASAEKYLKVSAILWRSLHWPDADRLSRKDGLTAGDFRNAFLLSTSGWRREAIGIELSKTGWLREVRLCYGRDFRPTACAPRQFGARDSAAMKIWRGL